MKHKAIFLDRDGVLNHAIIRQGRPYPPRTLSELSVPSDVKSALDHLRSAGYLLIVVTNQPDVARNKTTIEQVNIINEFLQDTLALDDVRVCFHDDELNCKCRKPKPGLITQAASDYQINLFESFMIGDRWKDIEAGIEAGCATIWLKNEYKEPKPPRPPDFIANSLSEAAEWILKVSAQPLGGVSKSTSAP